MVDQAMDTLNISFKKSINKFAKKYNQKKSIKKVTYKKKIVFITGTRADYGKINSVINILKKKFKIYIYVTGMHMLSKYGGTYIQIKKENKSFANITLYKNQYTDTETTGIVFGRTISNFSKYLFNVKPDMVLVHGDRYESLAAAISAHQLIF